MDVQKAEMSSMMSPEFQKIIADSRSVALRTCAPEITSDHILMAALASECGAGEAIRRGGADPEQIREHLADRYPFLREEFTSAAPILLTEEAEQAISESFLESEQWNSSEVDGAHFVMAALKLGTPAAGRTLGMYNLSYDKVAPVRG